MRNKRDLHMTKETILANAKIILPDAVIPGSVVLRDGVIADIAEGSAVPQGAVDCEGRYLAPGLVELHTDNLERHMKPRPKVDWPHRAAIIAHDRELAGTGITTVFDAIRVGSILSDEGRKRYGKYARDMADEILMMRDSGALAISHHIHLRAEICSETLEEELAEFGPDDKVGIVSLMDHTPGQRQFRDVQKFEDYVCGKNGLPREDFGDYVTFLHGLQDRLGAKHEAAAVAAAEASVEADAASAFASAALPSRSSRSHSGIGSTAETFFSPDSSSPEWRAMRPSATASAITRVSSETERMASSLPGIG